MELGGPQTQLVGPRGSWEGLGANQEAQGGEERSPKTNGANPVFSKRTNGQINRKTDGDIGVTRG